MSSFLEQSLVLTVLFFVLSRSATWAVRSSMHVARIIGFSEFVISFVVVTLVSILPETTIAIISAWQGVPSLGLGTLLGSNVADLTFVMGVVALTARRDLRVEGVFVRKDYLFLGLLILPLVLGFTGYYSRLDGVILVLTSCFFFFSLVRTRTTMRQMVHRAFSHSALLSLMILIASIVTLGLASYYTVRTASSFADGLGLAPALVGLVVVALGTTLPELIFSIRAARTTHATLALGDVLGTVIADATLVVGVVAIIHPFAFNPRLIIVTGLSMLFAGLLALSLLRSGRRLTRSEGLILLVFYAVFVMIEFLLRDWTPLIHL